MATLFNTKISQTYEGLLKTIDNGVITATLKELTDGSGNQSGLLLNTAGDFKVTSVLEWGSLKDTGTGVTITQFVTAANGIENFNNDTTLPTSAAVKLYVDTKFSQTDTLTEVLGFGNTTSGKDIAVSAGDDVTFTDTSKAIFGTSSEFEIFQDTADSRITTLSNLYIQTPIFRVQKTGGESMIQAFTDGAVQLFFNGVKKIETTLLGSTVTGDLLVTGTITGAGGSFLPLAGGIMTGNTIHNDNVKSIYGTASDGLEIFHDSNNSFIKDTGTGVFNIQGSTQVNIGSVNGQIGFQFVEGANTAMRHANVTKLSTESTGIAVTGALSTTSNVTVGANATFVDNGKAIFGAGSDLSIYHNSTNSYLDNDNGDLYIRNNFQDRDIILQSDNGGGGIATYIQIDGSTGKVELSHYGTKRLETVSDGAKVTGNLEVTGTITGAGGSFLPLIGGTMTGDTIHNDNVKSIYGTGSDLEIFHSGTNSEINNSTGGLLIKTNTFRVLNAAGTEQMLRADTDDAVQLYFNNVVRLATTNTGIAVTGGGSFTGNVEVGANNINFANNGKARFGNQANLQIYSDGSNSFIDNTGGTQSTIFKTSNNSPLDTTALIINRSGDLITGNDVTIAGDLTVNGTTTTVNSQTLSVVDPLISLATANAANSLDIGFYGKYNDGTPRYLGLYNDASDSNKFKLFKNTTVEPTTVVSQAGGYQAADLVVAGLESSSFVSTGTVSATSFISTTDVGIDINGIALTRVAANSAIRVSEGLETIGLLRSYGALAVATTGSFGGNVTTGQSLTVNGVGNNSSLTLGANTGNWVFTNVQASRNLEISDSDGTGVALTIDTNANVSFAGEISLLDNKAISFGPGGKAFMKHDGSNFNFFNDIGNATFTNRADNKDIRFATDNGSGGTTTYFTIDGLNEINQFSKNVSLSDNVIAKFGNSSDLQIYHDGNDSYISDTGTGLLFIRASSALRIQGANGESMIDANENGAVNLYYDNSKKFETTSTGVNIFDTLKLGTTGTAAGKLITADSMVFQIDSDNSGTGSSYRFRTNGTADDGIELMRIQEDGKVGIGELSPDAKLHIHQTGSGTVTTIITEDDARKLFIGRDSIKCTNLSNTATALFIQQDGGLSQTGGDLTVLGNVGLTGAGDPIFDIFRDSGANHSIRLHSEGVSWIDNNNNFGIGTNTPSAKLEIKGDGASTGTFSFKTFDSNNNETFFIEDGGRVGVRYSPFSVGIPSTTAVATNAIFQVEEAGSLTVLDGGNVGIGTTAPQRNLTVFASSGNAVFQLANATSGVGSSDGFLVFTNGVDVGLENKENGYLSFATNASEKMRILQDGKVGIGTDSPSTTLDVRTDTGVLIKGKTGSANAKISFLPASGGRQYDLGNVGADFRIFDASANVTRMYFDNDRNTGINTITPRARLEVFREAGVSSTPQLTLGTGESGSEAFSLSTDTVSAGDFCIIKGATNSAANVRLRITPAGNVLIGTNVEQNAKLFVSDANDRGFATAQFRIEGNGYTVAQFMDTSEFTIQQNSNGRNIRIMSKSNGVRLTPNATAWTSASDEILKENIKPLNNVLDKIKDYRCVEYNFKNDKDKKIGFIAQDWEKDFNAIVSKDKKGILSMKYTETIPVLLKAIQELKAEIELLKAK